MAGRSEIERYLNDLLTPESFRDYGPNGLQIEGKPEVRTLVSGVTASLALIDAAIADGADAILVHHGLFWRGQDGRLTGWLACGHHATERYGAPAVAAHVAERFGLAHRFIDLENPA